MTDNWQIRLENILADYLREFGELGVPVYADTSTGDRERPSVVISANVDRPSGGRHVSAEVAVVVMTNANDTSDTQGQTLSAGAVGLLVDVDSWADWVATKDEAYLTGWAVRKRWLSFVDIDTDSSENTREIRQQVGFVLEVL